MHDRPCGCLVDGIRETLLIVAQSAPADMLRCSLKHRVSATASERRSRLHRRQRSGRAAAARMRRIMRPAGRLARLTGGGADDVADKATGETRIFSGKARHRLRFAGCTIIPTCQSPPTKTMKMENLQEKIAESSGWIQAVKDEMGQVLVGQERLVDRLLIGLLCNGHILLEGVPGLAKTLAVKALSGSLHTTFARFPKPPISTSRGISE